MASAAENFSSSTFRRKNRNRNRHQTPRQYPSSMETFDRRSFMDRRRGFHPEFRICENRQSRLSLSAGFSLHRKSRFSRSGFPISKRPDPHRIRRMDRRPVICRSRNRHRPRSCHHRRIRCHKKSSTRKNLQRKSMPSTQRSLASERFLSNSRKKSETKTGDTIFETFLKQSFKSAETVFQQIRTDACIFTDSGVF